MTVKITMFNRYSMVRAADPTGKEKKGEKERR